MSAIAALADNGAFSPAELDGHAAALAERVFQIDTKWPHYRQLLGEVRGLAEATPPHAAIVSLERTLLYGGCSLVAPFFQHADFISVDCSPASADGRGAYNGGMTDDPRFLRVPLSRRARPEAQGLSDGCADLLLVPNLVHHVADQAGLFGEIARLLKPGGRVWVFEPLLRELHQMPDDYIRYTPFGLVRTLREAGLEPGEPALEGGPFSAIAYRWVQALEYFPSDRRAEMERWFYDEHCPELLAWDDAYRDNLVRNHTCFPVSFSVVAEKSA
ncbi:MAG: methyltransferase domain-containing protein [Alphaproteobacteria bacterium]|jgi:SAM-dependent methyltransferase